MSNCERVYSTLQSDIATPQLRLFDFIGVHFYEYDAFTPNGAPATKGELRDAMNIHTQFFPEKFWYITEYGINDTKQVRQPDKGTRYAKLLHAGEGWPSLPDNVVGAVYYHLAMKGDLHPEYHIYPEGDKTYKVTCEAAEAAVGSIPMFGASSEAAPTAPPGDIPSRLAQMIADLADYERSLLLRRAESRADFSADDAKALQRARKAHVALEKALRLIGD